MNELSESNYLNRAEEEFGRRLDVLSKTLEADITKDRISFGPTLHVATSSGTELDIYVVRSKLDAPRWAADMDNSRLTLMALDKGKLVGFRTANLLDYSQYPYEDENRPDDKGYEIMASGEIATLKRGVGVGMALELGYMFCLQQEANKRQATISHRVDPQNLRDVAGLTDLDDSRVAALVKSKQDEARRWEAMYGSEGILGYTQYVKKIKPDNLLDEMSAVSDVWIGRSEIDSNGRKILGVNVDRVSTNNLNALEAKKFFDDKIWPQIKR